MSKEGTFARKIIRTLMFISGKTFYDVGEVIGVTALHTERIGRDRGDYTVEQLVKIAKSCGFHIYIQNPEVKIDITSILDVTDYERDVHIDPEIHKMIGKKVIVDCGEELKGELSYSNGFYYINGIKFQKTNVKKIEEE